MGYHADVYTGIANLLTDALPSTVPVLNALTVTDAELDRYAASVVILREGISYDRHPEIAPSTSLADQPETWTWSLYVTGGGGSSLSTGAAAQVDLYLEMIRDALNAQRPTDHCGPLHLVSEDYEGRDASTVMYVQRWTHTRLQG
jgi:hypothetical protein